jgi:hypothetical protein
MLGEEVLQLKWATALTLIHAWSDPLGAAFTRGLHVLLEHIGVSL